MKRASFFFTKHTIPLFFLLVFSALAKLVRSDLGMDPQLLFRLTLFLFFSAVLIDNHRLLSVWLISLAEDPKHVILAIPQVAKAIRSRGEILKLLDQVPLGREAWTIVSYVFATIISIIRIAILLLTSWVFVTLTTGIFLYMHLRYIAATVEFPVLGIVLLWLFAVRSYKILSKIAITVTLIFIISFVYSRLIHYEVLTEKIGLWAFIFLCIGVFQEWIVAVRTHEE